MNRPDDHTRSTLLDTARTLLETEGPAALTVRHIAAKAGMSTMNVYSRFGGKDGIIDELYCEGFHRLRASIATGKHCNSDDPVENFRAPGIAYRDFALANYGFYSLMFLRPIPTYSPSPAARRVALDRFDELVAGIRQLMDDSANVDRDAHKIAASHWATCHGHVALEISRIGPNDIDWETTLLGSLDALRLSIP